MRNDPYPVARGLCYYISTESDSYLDAGMLATRAGVDPSRLEEAITAVRDEYAKCAADGITDEELTRAKSYFKGRMTLGLEDSEERAHFYGKQLLLYPKVRDIPDYFTAIDGVTKKQIDARAKRILTPEAQRLVVISSEKSEEKFHRLIGA